MRLRIISGSLKGRFIQAPASKGTRPTTDRVRETLFNILNNEFDFEDAIVLDVYAGSGSLGFEALSRGAKHVDFIENNFNVTKNLQKNIDDLGVKSFCSIIKTEAVRYVQSSSKKYDLILADPPFFEYDIYDVFAHVVSRKTINEEGIMVIERSIQTADKDKENFGFEAFKRIGDAMLYKYCL